MWFFTTEKQFLNLLRRRLGWGGMMCKSRGFR
jgi:hypothetical protein